MEKIQVIIGKELKEVEKEPNSGKICSCGKKILYFVHYDNKKGEHKRTPISEKEETIDIWGEVKTIKTLVNHWTDCKDFAKFIPYRT